MRGDEHVLHRPERMVGRQRFLVEHVKRRPGNAARLSASTRAGSSTTPPRARLIKKLDGFIAANTLASMLLRVASVSGVSSTKKSNSPTTCKSSSRPCMRSNPATARGAELTPTTRMPNALHFGASASAMSPTPKMPTVLLCKSCAGQRRHCRSSWARTAPGRSRASASMVAMRGFRDRRPVDAADIGDDHVLAQRRLVDEVVDAGAQRLDPFQAVRLLQDLRGEHRREGEERVGGGDMGADLGVMIDQCRWRPRESALAVGRDIDCGPTSSGRAE